MKLRGTLVICLTLSMLVAGAAVAQQPSHEHNTAGQQSPASGGKPGMPAHGDQAHQMQHTQHMEMCRQMMGQPGMMGGGIMRDGMMMPMMMGGDPKQQAEMMAMRGEMMKAMGDIMMKYAQRMQSSK